MKKVLLVFLAVLLVLGSMPAVAEGSEDGWQNILLMGGDSRSTKAYGRTDTMIILSVNQTTAQIKLTSIMRDTWVTIPGRNGKAKINAANVCGGPTLAMDTVNSSFGTDIEKYVVANMSELLEIIDLLGGVDMEITESERKYINSYAKDYLNSTASYAGATSVASAGLVHLNGLLAMSFTRNRYTDSDYGRVMRQQKLLLAMLEKAQDMEVDDLMNIADQVFAKVESNLDPKEMKSLAKMALIVEPADVEQFRIPDNGTFESGMYNGTWCIRPDFAKNAKRLHAFIYGE